MNMTLSAASGRLTLHQRTEINGATAVEPEYLGQTYLWPKWMDWEKLGWTIQLIGMQKYRKKYSLKPYYEAE